MTTAAVARKVWEPHDVEATELWRFKVSVERTFGTSFADYNALYRWSIENRSDFWIHCLQWFPIIYAGSIPRPCVDESAPVQTVPVWFRGVHLNFAQNILFTRSPSPGANTDDVSTVDKEDNKCAVTQVRELSSNEPIQHFTWSTLRARVAKWSDAMRKRGVRKGDRIALIASTSIDTLTVFLATASIGALFSSSSTDMGVKGLLDRLLQIRPKFVFFDDAAVYNGKHIDLRPKIAEVLASLCDVSEFESVVTQPRFPGRPADIKVAPLPNSQIETCDEFLRSGDDRAPLTFEPCAFHDPLLIVYSSGTTGPPKCIVHSHGGVVLNGQKEARLHRAVDASSTQLQYTTTGWIMYLSSVQTLVTGARMICYDGSPFLPDPTSFVRLLETERVTHFGTSPRYLATLQQRGIVPRDIADLHLLRVVNSTGSALSDALFEWFYDVAFPPAVQLNNVSGGTDLAGAWGTGCPILPVYVGGCQCLSLGMKVEVFEEDPSSSSSSDSSTARKRKFGRKVPDGQPGDLVCTAAFPSMPVFFWGDADGRTYFDSYFAKFDGAWTHGDFIRINPRTQRVAFLGRADGVLNPSGVRFGSSEIYGVLERHFAHEIAESLCVGQRRRADADERVLLFVQMKPGHTFGPRLVHRLKSCVARELSKRHVPAYVFETDEIPVTINGKKVELPVKKAVSGEEVAVSGTLANPASLEFYKKFAFDENLIEVGGAKL